MNTDVLKGKWKQLTGDIKKSFGKLTDDDLTQIEGDRDKMLGKLKGQNAATTIVLGSKASGAPACHKVEIGGHQRAK